MRIFPLLFLVLIVLTGCSLQSPVNETAAGGHKLAVAATFYPLYDLTRSIAGDKADVYSIIPLSAEPHDYENSPQDIIKLNKADVFVTLGIKGGLAQFEQKLVQSASPDVRLIDAGAGLQQISLGNSNVSENLDPHIWVSVKNAEVMAGNIRDGLAAADPSNADYYKENAARLISGLKDLDANFTSGLSDCSVRIILAAHDAYAYLARDYNFTTYYVSGLSPEQEPTPQQIARLVDIAREYNLKYIFYEKTTDPRISNTIADQVGARTIELNPSESADNPNTTFISIMQSDLKNLEEGMGCSQ